jgi:hypothetical protein
MFESDSVANGHIDLMAFEKKASAAGALAHGYQLSTGRYRVTAHESNNSISNGIVNNTSFALQSTNPVGCFFLAIRDLISRTYWHHTGFPQSCDLCSIRPYRGFLI